MGQSKRLSVKKITGDVFGTVTDVLLWNVYLVGASFGKKGSYGVYKAFQEADDMLAEFNHNTIVSAWHQLTNKRLITYQKRGNLYHPQITKFGKKRLEEIVPTYQPDRPWDGKIYLVTYDVPEAYHKKRDSLRHYLEKLGCKLLQESVWLTPYNPRELISQFISREKIPETIIVSDMGRDGGVGESTIQDLIVQLYKLEKLNDRYEEFINKTKSANKQLKQLLMTYLSILHDDPQLPFALLPKGWLGDTAQTIYNSLIKYYN